MRIWDIHVHPDGERIPGRGLAEKAENLLRLADRMGVERLGLFLEVEKYERDVEPVLARHRDRLFGFIWLVLWNVPAERSIALVDRWVRNGPLIGIKLGGYSGRCHLPQHDAVFTHAASLGAVIYIHTWLKVGGDPPRPGGANLPHESTPQQLALLAARHPEMPLICGHTGGDWELGIRAVRPHRNISVEVGGGFPGRGQVEMGVKELGAARVIFGSDLTGRGFASQLAKVHGAAIPDRDKELIFSGNLRRLAAPIAKAKGLPF
jgi:uncharacterized protein